jgi:hypothetical protein
MDKKIYRAEFRLMAEVKDFDAAYRYLTIDDMTGYLHDDDRVLGRDKVISIEWILDDVSSGYIEVVASEELSEEEKKSISGWIKGQNSDGLGEGFEQQDWACYTEEEYDEDGFYYDDYIMASFDWETNDYELKEV